MGAPTASSVSAITGTVIKILVYAVLFTAVLKKDMSAGDFTMFLAFSFAFSNALFGLLQKSGDYKKASLETDDFRSFIDLEIGGDETASLFRIWIPMRLSLST